VRFRKMRIAWSVAWILLAVLLCVLWVRSYRYYDVGTGGILSMRGNLYITQMLEIQPLYASTDKVAQTMLGTRAFPAADYLMNPIDAFTIPLWFLVALSASLAPLPWLRWDRRSKRYSLRTLLIATTLVAVVLGLVVWAAR
jgi:hypothetical protein